MPRELLVLGLGTSGAAAARRALADGDEVTVFAGEPTAASRDVARVLGEAGARVVFGCEDVTGSFDVCVASPGIPQVSSFYQSALRSSAELISEPEYAWRSSPAAWIAVTGTNGKSTTAALISHILCASGVEWGLCGNTQDETATDVASAIGVGGIVVCELSSFQLASTRRFAPEVGVLTNIGEDHLAWHGGRDAYARAKKRLFANMKEGSTAVVCAGVDGWEDLERDLRGRGARFVVVGERRKADCAFCDGDASDARSTLVLVDSYGSARNLCTVGELRIAGPHNVANALAAAAAALALSASDGGAGGCASAAGGSLSPASVAGALRSFTALSHRIERCGDVGSVEFFDDSKATNPDAAAVAVRSFAGRPVVLLAGGRDKGGPLDDLVAAAAGCCRAVVCFGEGGARFERAMRDGGVPAVSADGLRDAFAAACDLSRPGDVVVLSPACASFDEFTSYAERGDVFKALVADAAAAEGSVRCGDGD